MSIIFENSSELSQYEDIARDFLDQIFNLDYDECFISNRSTLSDFDSCCLPETETLGKLNDMHKIAQDYMVKAIFDKYGIVVSPRDYLITAFEKIKQSNT